MPRPPSFKTSFVMRVLGMSNTGVTGIFLARQVWIKFLMKPLFTKLIW